MKYLPWLGLSLLLQLAFTSPEFPWFLAPVQPWLVVVVALARGAEPAKAGWYGLLAGLLADGVRGSAIGPSGIAGALAGAAVARAWAVFELTGPLFWVGGAFLAALVVEAASAAVYLSLGTRPPHGVVGAAAALAGTGLLALLAAFGEWWWGRTFSPEARRRRALRRR
jgi:cell shape-determining protein MreD